MKTKIQAIITLQVLLLSQLITTYEASADNLSIVQPRVNQIQANDPSLPSGVSEPKGLFGTIIANVFDTAGKINPEFLTNLLSGVSNNVLPKWNGSNLVGSSISDNGSITSIGQSTSIAQSSWPALDVTGGVRVNGGNWLYLQNNRLYGDNATALYYDSNDSNTTQFILRDNEATPYGTIHGSGNGANFGLLDGDSQWSYMAVKDSYTQFRINNNPIIQLETDNLYSSVQQQQIGWNRLGNRYAYTDYQGDDTWTDYGLRVLRGNAGANSWSELTHRGTGDFIMQALDAGTLKFATNSATRMTIAPNTGHVSLNTGSAQLFTSYDGSNNYRGSFGWNALQLGNNGTNYVVGGRTAAGGSLAFVVNNTNDAIYPTAPNGTTAMTIGNSANIGIGNAPTADKLSVTGNISATGDLKANRLCDEAGGNCATIPISNGISGTTNYVSKFTGASTIGNSQIIDNGTNVGVGMSPTYKLDVSGDVRGTWFRTNGAGLYSETYGSYFYAPNASYWYSRTNNGMVIQTLAGGNQGYVYHDGAGSFGLLHSLGGRAFRTWNGGNEIYQTTYATDFRPQIIYDRDDSNYYVDPNGASRFSTANVNGTIFAGVGATSGALGLAFNYSGNNVLNTFGSEYSSAATAIGWGVKPNSGAAGYVSSSALAASAKGLLTMTDNLVFSTAPSSLTAIGTAVTMNEKFRVDQSGNLSIPGDLKANRLCDEAGGNCATIPISNGISGTTNYVSKFTGASTIGNSQIIDNGTNVGVGMSPTYKLDVSGNARVNNTLYFVNGTQRLVGDGSSALYYYGAHSTVTQQLFYDAEGTIYGRVYGDGDGVSFGLLHSAGGWGVRTWNGGNELYGTSYASDMRSSIFYDRDNTGFYVDPASVSILNDIRPNIMYDGQDTTYYSDPNATSRVNTLNVVGNVNFQNVGTGPVGVYDATKTQAVWSMGPSYVLPAGGGTTTYGSLYGLGWSYNPNYGGAGNNPQSKPGLNHQLLLMMNGVTYTALGNGIWTNGTITGNGGASIAGNTILCTGNAAGCYTRFSDDGYVQDNNDTWLRFYGNYNFQNQVSGPTPTVASNLATKGYVDGVVTGGISGTTNYMAKFTGANTVGNSQVIDNGTNVGVGMSPTYKLDVAGDTRTNWLRLNSGYGIYSEAFGSSFTPFNASYWYSRNNYGMVFQDLGGTATKGYVYFDGPAGSNFGLLHNGGGWGVRVWNGGTELYGTSYASDFRPSIMYDRDNTAYQVDPNGSSILNSGEIRNANPQLALHKPGVYATYIGLNASNRVSFGGWSAGANAATLEFDAMYDGDNNTYYVDPNSVSVFQDIRPSIIYDRDNTGYYVDPNSSSNLSTLRTAGFYTQNNASPTMVMQDTDHRSAVLHTNSNQFYVLSGNGVNGTSWAVNGTYWPLQIDMNTDQATFGGNVWIPEGSLKVSCVGNCF